MINTPKHDAEPICCCGEPMTLGVVHRKDKPCFHWYAHDAEPVAWLQLNKFGKPSSVSLEKGSQYKSDYDEGCRDIPLYTAPPSGIAAGMEMAEIADLLDSAGASIGVSAEIHEEVSGHSHADEKSFAKKLHDKADAIRSAIPQVKISAEAPMSAKCGLDLIPPGKASGASAPSWVTAWPDHFGIHGNVEVVPKSDYDALLAAIPQTGEFVVVPGETLRGWLRMVENQTNQVKLMKEMDTMLAAATKGGE